MTIEALTKVQPPPMVPHEPFMGSWLPIEAELGTRLPPDYKAFARLYGSGYWLNFLGIFIPRHPNSDHRFELQCRVISRVFAKMEVDTYPIWPQSGGLIPFGLTNHGDSFFWMRKGPPEEWRVVVRDRGLQNFEIIDRDMTGFLAGLITGEVLPEAFPEGLLPCRHVLIPYWVAKFSPR